MRKFTTIVLGLALAAFVGATAYANCGSCAGDAQKTAGCAKTDCAKGGCDACSAKKASCGEECLKELKLTADQQAAVKKLTAKCSEVGCDVTSKKQMMEGLKKILNEEQMAALKKHCADKKCGMLGPIAQLFNNQFACGGSCTGKGKKDGEGEDALIRSLDNQFACGGSCTGKGKKDGEGEDALIRSLDNQFACGGSCTGKGKKDGEGEDALIRSLDNQFACGGSCTGKGKKDGEGEDALIRSLDNQFACGKSCGDKDKKDDGTQDA